MAFEQLTDIAKSAAKVTKSDTVDVNAKSLWVGTAGTLNLETYEGAEIAGFPAKEGLLPLAVKKVKTGGTASDIWALT